MRTYEELKEGLSNKTITLDMLSDAEWGLAVQILNDDVAQMNEEIRRQREEQEKDETMNNTANNNAVEDQEYEVRIETIPNENKRYGNAYYQADGTQCYLQQPQQCYNPNPYYREQINQYNQDYQQYGNGFYTQDQQMMYNQSYPQQQIDFNQGYNQQMMYNQGYQQQPMMNFNQGYNQNMMYNQGYQQQPRLSFYDGNLTDKLKVPYQGPSTFYNGESLNPREEAYYNSEQYQRDYQSGWSIYHDQYGNDLSNGNYVYNGAYVSNPAYDRTVHYAKYIPGVGYVNEQTGTVLDEKTKQSYYDPKYHKAAQQQMYGGGYNQQYNNYQQQNYNYGYGFDYNSWYEQQLAQQERMEQLENQQRIDMIRMKAAFRASTNLDPDENKKEFEDFYLYNTNPDMYYQKYMQEQAAMTYAERDGFVGSEAEKMAYNKTMKETENGRRMAYMAYWMEKNPDKYTIRYNPTIAERQYYSYLDGYTKGLNSIIPQEKKGKLTFEEMNNEYLAKILAFCENYDYDFNRKRLNNRYSETDFKKLMEYHRRSQGMPHEGVFDPMKVINGEEIHLPDWIRQKRQLAAQNQSQQTVYNANGLPQIETEEQERRRRFVESINNLQPECGRVI